jgi:hypothetical protein
MIKVITDLPGDVVGFEAVGKVEADDCKEVLDPAVAKVIDAHGAVRMLYVLGDEYEGFTAGAMWQDSMRCAPTRWAGWTMPRPG